MILYSNIGEIIDLYPVKEQKVTPIAVAPSIPETPILSQV
jgi:hypothetical protein